MRIGLGLGLSGKEGRSKGPLCEAISQKVLVTAMSGNKSVTIAPHVVYNRNGEQWVEGVEFDGKKGKLGKWKVPNLSEIKLTDLPFTPDPSFNPNDTKPGDEVVCVLSL